ncbi:MAG TPA: BTAD domain-containing putative transcriptional regulator [Longimicrobiales bacterium]|nr:BTAD domain-containing putative transcriptional regulator [Longimicrobiales bacterium]
MTTTGSGPGRGTLPVELTHFIGRERELAALRQLAESARLLTLTGAGGSGKSRLALQLVTQIPGTDADDVAWVELAPLMEERLVAAAVQRALGSPTEGGAASADSIIATLGDRSLTLVLDNCEHLVDTCAALADTLLRACPHLRIIATSREALGVAGERAWLVPPLALPAPDDGLDALASSDAVRLFVDRARDVLPSFTLSAANARVIADICMHLDGIPLAIELAAARVRHLSPEQIRDRLSDAFSLLTSGARTALPRHRTLRAALDWSHDLLREEARVVLRRLAVFRGGFTLDMVEEVASGDGIAPHTVLDLIAVLADRSMIVVREQDGSARYHLLETMRQYAEQRLAEAGETERVRGRLAAVISARVAAVEPSFTTRARRSAFAQLEPELDNIREVLSWTREHDPQQHVRLVGMLWWFWFSTRYWVEAHRWLSDALELPAAREPTRERAALLFAIGALAALRAQPAVARPYLEEAAVLAAAVGDARLEAYALNYIGMTWSSSLSPTAREYTARAERWMRANGDEYGLRLALLLGGMAEFGAGNRERAIEMMEEAVQIARSFGQDRELAVALQTYATVLIGSAGMEKMEAMVLESLEALRRDPSFLFIARAIDYRAYCRSERDPRAAAREIGIASAMRRHIGANRFQHDDVVMDRLVGRLRELLGDVEYERAFDEGTHVQPAHALDEVLGGAATQPAAVQPIAPLPAVRTADTAVPVPAAASPAPSPVATDLCVRALGPFEVEVQGTAVSAWPYAKPKELLAFLLLRPQGRTRAEIGAALWPEASPAQVRNSFHVTMHHVRRTIGHADWVVLDGERYMIAPGVTVDFDVAAFQEQAESAMALDGDAAVPALRSAMRLYRDHFLAGETAGAWRDDVQDRLRRLYCNVGLRLAELLETAGDDADAAEVYERVIACEPLHEAAHRGLLLALTRAGRRAHALRHYDRLLAVLQSLELEPEEETLELYERIRSADIVPGG